MSDYRGDASSERLSAASRELIEQATRVRKRAYARYSGFLVGAAVRTKAGEIFTGCNVENRSYGLTVCAERVAVFTAIASGEVEFVEIAIATDGGCPPCGACLQVLSEFAPKLAVLLVDASKPFANTRTTLDKLLPNQFVWPGPESSS